MKLDRYLIDQKKLLSPNYFKTAYKEFDGKLHATLVALGVSEKTGFEDVLDRVILVSKSDLENYSVVAEKISVYVATCMKERHKLISK